MSSPLSSAFLAEVLAPLEARYRAGADDAALREELLRSVLPWVCRQVSHNVRRIPANADPNNVSSLMHEAAYLAVQRLDWAQWCTWPRYLATLVRRAGQEAARQDDYLSRHQRVLRKRFRAALASEEDRLGRAVNYAERQDVALRIANQKSDLADFLLVGWHPYETAEMHEQPLDELSVEKTVERDTDRQAVRAWLTGELPEDVRVQVLIWLESPRSQVLPRRLEHQLRPYVGRLLASVEDRSLASDERSRPVLTA